MPVSLSAQLGSKEQADVRLAGSVMSALRVSMPGIVQSFDPDTVTVDAPRDKCTLSCAINGIHAAFHYLKKNYISGCVMTVPTGW